MEQLTLEQAAAKHALYKAPVYGEHHAIEGFKAGAAWQKEHDEAKFQRLIKLVDSLVYYSQIHTVNGVRPANMDSHEKTWREAQKWLWDNCENTDGEYSLK